jgi:phenylalanyl-tRNA synthetase beta chain
MKCSEAWLREWVNPNLSREELCEKLTMTGLEVDELAPVASPFSHVVVGEVLTVEPHPQADRLKLCEVNVGNKNPLHIVCGADNVRPGIKVPTAIAGAILPNGMTIKETKLRGELSQGMLCSSVEIGLAEESKGLLILPDDAPVGEDLRQYLQLDDYIIDVSITPNRGDCLSIKGLAREIAASTQTQLTSVTISDVKPAISDTFNVNALATDACPVYVGRIIRDVKADTPSPMWLKERLRRSGNRSISIIVDIVNYVMLELGQPMHAFDLDTLQDHISVRYSKQGEKITLLDGSEKITDDKTLVISKSY